MFFQVNGLQITNLQKAKKDGIITVDIIANHLTEDEDGETVLKEAFSPEAIQTFISIGTIDYWHETKNPNLTKDEKMQNILGRPISFRWENGLPVVTAELTKNHPIVQTMLPHLEAENPVYAASIGGSKIVLEAADQSGRVHKVIPKIKWDHLAIAPANMVVNRESGVNVKLLQKAQGLYAEFDNIDSFARNSAHIFDNEQVLVKALEAPSSVGDMYNTPGGVITKQSLEKSSDMFSEDEAEMLVDTIIKISRNELPFDRGHYYDAFPTNVEFADKSYRLFDKYFNSKRRKQA